MASFYATALFEFKSVSEMNLNLRNIATLTPEEEDAIKERFFEITDVARRLLIIAREFNIHPFAMKAYLSRQEWHPLRMPKPTKKLPSHSRPMSVEDRNQVASFRSTVLGQFRQRLQILHHEFLEVADGKKSLANEKQSEDMMRIEALEMLSRACATEVRAAETMFRELREDKALTILDTSFRPTVATVNLTELPEPEPMQIESTQSPHE